MEQQHGTWGTRICTYQTEQCLVTMLFLDPHKRCSYHSHQAAFNQFFVVCGKLTVVTDTGPGGKKKTLLTDKQSFTVSPGVMHEFRTHEVPTIVEEIAYVRYDDHDIQREIPGGDITDER